MLDPDTFLTTLYVMTDTFCTTSLPPEPHPGPDASLTRSEVLTLARFGQWAHFQSERDFYRYAERHLRPAFPALPDRAQFNRLLRAHRDAMSTFAVYSRGTTWRLRVPPMKRWTAPACQPATPNDVVQAGSPILPTSAGAIAWGGMKASIS